MRRTTYAGLVDEKYLDQEVCLKGWVQKRRNLGNLIFIDLRDIEGIVQLVFSQEFNPEALKVAEQLRSEYVIEVKGKVVARGEKAINPNMRTGKVEVEVSDIEILNKAKTTPFDIADDINASDDLRLQYRYLDLRRPEMQKALMIRNRITQTVHSYLDENHFLDIETPYLTRSTPEGARDYLVPSRVYPGHFYALPQSPQLFKQLLMGAGYDRYYQIARCFRDEDLRGDRQPEFTQIDIETSFMSAEEIQEMTEGLLKRVMKETLDVDIKTPIQRITWNEAMDRFGSDKPDIRFGMELKDMSGAVQNAGFKVFDMTLENGGQVKAITVPGGADKYSRKQIEEKQEYIKRFGAKGLAWVKVTDDGLTGPIAKFFTERAEDIKAAAEAKSGDLILFVASNRKVVADSLGYLRVAIAKEMDMINKDEFAFIWVVDWPLFEYSEEFDRYIAAHHPFTMPNEEDLDLLETDPHKCHAQSYDIVLNGYELGGGSIRIHRRDIQEAMFKALGFTKEKAEEQFGWFMDALDFGFPPHGGLALGLDRFAMLLAGKDNIREVIAFPKNSKASEPLTHAPSTVAPKQLDELYLKTDVPEEDE
ncbi:aspartate--tRNA ligase [Ligilactobacillus salivarius]|uniref:Aspartate--tRNA ligase n=6 Tax=Ligilactobacillus salivarius TaxID=1624 RepID=A0A1D7TSH5_9LACO|nr:aspartate--tRNA ligase [Ligilactobacillus salivarius]AOO73913.1 aspartate--tRNA ligase [Ligilactobacillus salivarius]ATP37970.1 aspartate--tRNA ligase [Ligilactobacillus salivarius]EEJ74685.1 aspartate--tRNA ligase [Ligilactobacillus salivarius DSM 20555 = ATCC 11741]KRM70846.1 aspartyl-tRNA synthetase [Ligilactobacillus salivarius DSM 20555 = ATCC 11741]MBE7937250.1 aspartate--tRNA ligase [Ligilactobacillus salivarius]